jgi:hypothetical protein
MKCPWCEKSVKVPEVAYLNAEIYGTNNFNFIHKPCGNKINVFIERDVKVKDIEKVDPKENLSFTQESFAN